METSKPKNVYLSFHKNCVRENIEYTDRLTGEKKTFNQVRLPSGTIIDGKDLGGYEFSPLFVNMSRFRGTDWRDIPLLPDREVWLQKSIVDPDGRPIIDEDGTKLKDTVKVMPQQIKDALIASRKEWAEQHAKDSRSLDDRAGQAREASDAMERETHQDRPLAREDR